MYHDSDTQRGVPMAKRAGDEGIWELAAPCPEGGRYAFVAEWRQELRHQESFSSRFGLPHEEAAFEAKPPLVGALSRRKSRLLAEDQGSSPEQGPEEDSCRAGTGAASENGSDLSEHSLAERLGKAEFLLELEEMTQVVSEAEGARLVLYVAPRLAVQAVEASAGDGSWGPLKLSRAETTEHLAGTDNYAVWVGDAPDFREEGAEEGSGIVLQVTRRDWRVDPYSLVLSKGDPNRRPSASGSKDEQLPWGPAVWCSAVAPPPPAKRFMRCADRELVLYELHLGSFTEEGTLKSATAKLGHVRDLGCTAVTLMPVQQDARRMNTGEKNMWGYDIISFIAIDAAFGKPADLVAFVAEAHRCGLAVFFDFVANHMMWGADALYGDHFFLKSMQTCWGPRPNYEELEVFNYTLAAVEFMLMAVGFDGVRVDSTKSIRKFPDTANDVAGAALLGELAALCRRKGRIAIAEDLEDGDGMLQQGGLGFHLQWDMAHFCWVFDALVNPLDEHRDFDRVVNGLVGLAPGRGHALRGRVLFTESHDTAACDRYGRMPAAVHNGKSFIVSEEGDSAGGDAFQKAQGALPYPTVEAVEANTFAARRAALGLVLILTAPGVPMLLQGQEVCESAAYKWPRGPTMDWQRVQAKEGIQAEWQQLCRDLIALRLNRSPSSASGGSAFAPAPRGRPGPLMGDGLHVFHQNAGVLAYLRWADVRDSREEDASGPEIALIIVNCTNNNFPLYELGVPPSKAWRLAINTVIGGNAPFTDVLLKTRSKATHGFPGTIGVSLQAYSALILLRQA